MKNYPLKKENTSNQNGMTLIEIMIVIAIIGSITTVLATSIGKNAEKAKIKQTQIVLQNIKQAIEIYNSDCAQYPQKLEDLMEKPNHCSNWGPTPYVGSKKGILDLWNHPIVYETNGDKFILKSLGKDGQEGGEGFNADIILEE